MTKSELIFRLTQRFPVLTHKDVEVAANTILKAMSDQLGRGERIEVRVFGSFSINVRPPRRGRNPKTGEQVVVPEKHVPHFKSGKELRELVKLS